MRLVTIGSLGASVALGLGAIIVARVALPDTGKVQAAQVVVSPMANAVSVVVAARDIAYGERLDAGHLKLIRVPKDAAPANAFASVAQVLAQDHGGAPVALTLIAAREPLLPAKLSGPGARPSVAAELEPGMRAYAIGVNDISGVGGHALPGDRVDVVMMRNMTPEGPHKVLTSQLVVQNVRVLGVDLNADPTSTKAEKPSTTTLEVSVKDAQKLAIAAELGSLSLALRPLGASDIEPVAEVASAAPRARRQLRPARASGAPSGGRITIVEGDNSAPAASAKPAA
ncbi:MAG: Flp pilus assembly protein CpaB [Phenylobacterium sp.]|uniref:Flp pilus assembly protein CpaB n=1 Tax=Phenylobacterium sp. TaxID=1871053 RepID=UPI001B4AE4A0|nr:Flp pilus assembly protein CpaB [Phenylobacterium sp.]MBP7651578.1 Flp pilus assembly protein CpaB [Phenylobacterium sp.]MBP7816962.1 Flp pilus assembly protein CpaB [Phenylobacterium sp.]MBP9231101.1 Flp pilus assembly protein CpaB [Phenylobacterium sp.]MBP9755338.1 Flp pilus assembly protein CpaB [Phenylobacterium sp.]